MRVLKLVGSFVVFLFIYSIISTIIDMLVNNQYNGFSYLVRRLIQLGLYILYLVYATRMSEVELKYHINFGRLMIYAIVLFSLIFLYEGTVDVLLGKHFTPDSASAARESDIANLYKYPMALFVQACISAPLLEEVLTRGILYELLHEHIGTVGAAFFCAIFFAVLHFDSFNTLFYLMIGFILSYIYIKTGSIMYCIILHMCVNAFSFTMYYVNS